MKKLLTIFVFMLVALVSNAQIALAKLKFEDAEQAYNAGNYNIALNKLNDAEKLFGKINPPILHLRILIEYKIFQKSGDFEVAFLVKKNCVQFLQDYADVEGLEEKFKEVYRISENLSDIPFTKEGFTSFMEKRNKEYQNSKKKYQETIDKYIEAIGGLENLQKVKTFEIITENIPEYKRDTKLEFIVRVKHKEYLYREENVNNITSIYIYTPEKYYIKNQGKITSGSTKEIKNFTDYLAVFDLLNTPSSRDSIFFEERIQGEKKIITLLRTTDTSFIRSEFDQQTGLKLSQEEGKIQEKKFITEREIQIKSYRIFDDNLKLIDNYLLTIPEVTPSYRISNSSSMLNSFIQSGSGKMKTYNMKVKSIKINSDFKEKYLD